MTSIYGVKYQQTFLWSLEPKWPYPIIPRLILDHTSFPVTACRMEHYVLVGIVDTWWPRKCGSQHPMQGSVGAIFFYSACEKVSCIWGIFQPKERTLYYSQY